MTQSIKSFSISLINQFGNDYPSIYNRIKEELEGSGFMEESIKDINDYLELDDSIEWMNYISSQRLDESEEELEESPKELIKETIEGEINQISIIQGIRKELGIKIPSRKNALTFSRDRLIEHISYWIFQERNGGKYSSSLMKSFIQEDQNEILRGEGINPDLIPNF